MCLYWNQKFYFFQIYNIILLGKVGLVILIHLFSSSSNRRKSEIQESFYIRQEILHTIFTLLLQKMFNECFKKILAQFFFLLLISFLIHWFWFDVKILWKYFFYNVDNLFFFLFLSFLWINCLLLDFVPENSIRCKRSCKKSCSSVDKTHNQRFKCTTKL